MFAESYTDGFMKYWTGAFAHTEGVVLLAVGVGIACIALIVFGNKWKK